MSTADYTTWKGLAKYLAQVCDVRSRRGQRYEWSYLLVLLAAALLAVVLVAFLPARSAARTIPAVALRSD